MEAKESAGRPPERVRKIETPAAMALGDLSAIFGELIRVVDCCEWLLLELAAARDSRREVLIEAVWSSALSSYARCFVPGPRGMGLTKEDITATNLTGKVTEWHEMLLGARSYYANEEAGNRENHVVGVSQDAQGKANGVAIMSPPRPEIDETTVGQTGHLALELSRIVDDRIGTQQETVYAACKEMSVEALEMLPTVELLVAESTSAEGG